MTLWQSGTESGPDDALLDFTSSLDLDRRLYPYDIEGSIAWARALRQIGIYTESECEQVVGVLRDIKQELDEARLELDPELEDIHMNVEQELTDRLPELGPRLHTGRSRNDQVLVDVKLYLKDAVNQLKQDLSELLRQLLDRAEGEAETALPGVTHLQPAQPISLAHYLLAFFEKYRRDYERLSVCEEKLDVLPLGSGALAGAGFEVDREFLAEQLGFSRVSRNSLDTVSSRDFMLDLLHALQVCGLHSSRLSEDWIIWSSPTVGFCRLADEFTTGSSIMPQKKNPDVLELIRGQTGRLLGSYQGLSGVVKGQPLAYNRDLQEDKFHLFTALDSVGKWLPLLAEVVEKIRFDRSRMDAEARENYLAATDVADYLAEKGLAFREAHGVVRRLVEKAKREERRLDEFTLEEFKHFSDSFEPDVLDLLAPEQALERRGVAGGTGPAAVRSSLASARDWLAGVSPG